MPASIGDIPPGMRGKADRIVALLEQAYGRPEMRAGSDPLDQLILTVLSQNTTDRNCRRAYDALRSRFPTWDAVLWAETAEIAGAIHCGGLAQTKAARIQCILRSIREQHGRIGLDFLADMPSEAVSAYLAGLPGVGPKTAACVLLFALRRPVLPVDTHVWRVAKRLGLIGATTSAERAHSALQALVAGKHVYSFHLNMIAHGRRVCRAALPRCEVCVLRDECSFCR